jgi:hypothetical protein
MLANISCLVVGERCLSKILIEVIYHREASLDVWRSEEVIINVIE